VLADTGVVWGGRAPIDGVRPTFASLRSHQFGDGDYLAARLATRGAFIAQKIRCLSGRRAPFRRAHHLRDEEHFTRRLFVSRPASAHASLETVETACVKVRLKPGSLGRVREWAAELNRRGDEVLATLRDEQVVVESVFLEQAGDGDFLIYYMKARNLEEAGQAVQHSHHEIDAYHQEFKQDTWESRRPLELLIDFENFD
jgi:Family of unknown function (DUF6176)